MKTKIMLAALSFALSGCVCLTDRVYHDQGNDVMVTLSKKQIDHYKDGTSMERVMIRADGEWYEIWNRPVTK